MGFYSMCSFGMVAFVLHHGRGLVIFLKCSARHTALLDGQMASRFQSIQISALISIEFTVASRRCCTQGVGTLLKEGRKQSLGNGAEMFLNTRLFEEGAIT